MLLDFKSLPSLKREKKKGGMKGKGRCGKRGTEKDRGGKDPRNIISFSNLQV